MTKTLHWRRKNSKHVIQQAANREDPPVRIKASNPFCWEGFEGYLNNSWKSHTKARKSWAKHYA